MKLLSIVAGITASLAATTFALAQEAGDPVAGKRLAEQLCAKCHALPGAVMSGFVAPNLVAVAKMPSTTGLSLHVFLQTPHAKMPNYQFSRAEMDDVIAYILSLKQAPDRP